MFKLDNEFLTSLGLGSIPVDEKNRLLQMIYERLEMNVGMRLAEKMTDQQLDEFESFIDRNDEGGALKWLETNFPNYKDVVAEELEKLKVEVQAAAPQILAASQVTNTQQGQINPSQMPQQPAFQQPMPGQAPQPQYGPMQQPASPPSYSEPQTAPQYGSMPVQPTQPQPAFTAQPSMPQPAQPDYSQPQTAFGQPPVQPQPYAPAPTQQPQASPAPQFQPPTPPQPAQQPSQPQQFTPPPPGFAPPQE